MARRTSAEVQQEAVLIARIRHSLMTNPIAVCKAIRIIRDNQTVDELASQETVVSNGIGFASCDARYGTFLANLADQKVLYGKLLDDARRIALRYSKTQLLMAAKQRAS